LKKLSPEEFLSRNDLIMAKLISHFGPSSKATQKPKPFDSLVKAVISQQLSNSASNSITNRIIELHGKRPFKADIFLTLSISDLRACGVSNSKIKTIMGVAEAVIKKEITIEVFKGLDDLEVQKKLISYWGIGTWTAQIFMMFCLKRNDVLALNDAGLQRAHSILYPNSQNLEQTSEKWRPYRAVAAIYLWKFLDNPESRKHIIF
jgi:DNA-3-methyladenine glycosylase II